jgi:hypothetical protein
LQDNHQELSSPTIYVSKTLYLKVADHSVELLISTIGRHHLLKDLSNLWISIERNTRLLQTIDSKARNGSFIFKNKIQLFPQVRQANSQLI